MSKVWDRQKEELRKSIKLIEFDWCSGADGSYKTVSVIGLASALDTVIKIMIEEREPPRTEDQDFVLHASELFEDNDGQK